LRAFCQRADLPKKICRIISGKSEMTVRNEITLPFDPVAFAGALIGAPLLATLMSCFLIVPLFALFFGAPVYLILGTPVLLWMVGRFAPTIPRFALAGFIANLLLLLALLAAENWVPATIELGFRDSYVFALFGLLFGPFWAGTFAALYRKFNRMQRLIDPS
jgi:hypothetical protein